MSARESAVPSASRKSDSSERLLDHHRQAADDQRDARLDVVERVPVSQESFVEEALAMIRGDDHRRPRPSRRSTAASVSPIARSTFAAVFRYIWRSAG